MNQQNTKILVESFPDLYDKDFLFECDDGWFNIIYGLSSAIDFFRMIYEDTLVQLDEVDSEHEFDYQVFQVKEKFGSLRYYTKGRVDKFSEQFIEQYEHISGSICEICGSDNARTKTSKWRLKSLCENCCEEHNKVVAKIAKAL